MVSVDYKSIIQCGQAFCVLILIFTVTTRLQHLNAHLVVTTNDNATACHVPHPIAFICVVQCDCMLC
eukprot:m.7869 g.7869  ORF g.7869 m.7869 type:complete len:67 (+) comp5297_c0_seq1:405-605(+)